MSETFSSRSIWWHYLCINIPKNLTRPKTAFLLIDGGSNTDRLEKYPFVDVTYQILLLSVPKPQDTSVSLMSMLAVSTGSITANLQCIPNVPIQFKVHLIQSITRIDLITIK